MKQIAFNHLIHWSMDFQVPHFFGHQPFGGGLLYLDHPRVLMTGHIYNPVRLMGDPH